MIPLELAAELRRAGLHWQPRERDCFVIPDRELDDQVFVLSQLTALLSLLHGQPAITFHGSSEWALDYLMTTDAIWLPSETQLRELIERLIGPQGMLSLVCSGGGYRCSVSGDTGKHEASGSSAEDAYGRALLAILAARS
ncbi:MAG TPA: hypothetical protein PKA05_03605 [Roseiflexaceae bacterium]|nr:hypothetical protein [Roseiflexaceae bacterium]HMP39444.1 hypothetical protein [Roseiflexaceae bacterium]